MIVDHFPKGHMLGQQVWIHLGEDPRLDGATVIASGYYRDDIMSLMVLLPDGHRIPNVANYANFHVNLVGLTDPADKGERRKGVPYAIRTFPNIVPAVRSWESEYGMDY